ncbi:MULTISPECIES: hypothetical protein [Paraburkholderia]
MKKRNLNKPMPLWAIWLISVVAILAWCGVHGETQDQEAASVRPYVCS